MRQIQKIRSRLGVTQAQLAAALGCQQSNISYYERGQTIHPSIAKKLIEYAATQGLEITYNHIYGDAELPDPPAYHCPVCNGWHMGKSSKEAAEV